MPTDYNNIRNSNLREYGEGTRHLSFLGRLYTDRTHFIFEILQNAEDAGATNILFELFEDRLEVKHDGRPFNEHDVRGICGIGEGTKAEDLMQIGKFGIGFKSVYAYTSAPEVHSGVEHFCITSYVRPCEVDTKAPGDAWTTLFVFSFDVPSLKPQTAMDEIAERLRNLSARTLLFLRKIKEIEYKLPDETGGNYLRGAVPRGQARQVTVIGNNNGQDENWLVFERSLFVPDSADEVWVEIGFKLDANSKDRNDSIVKIKESPLVVYFPTEKSTRFGFLVQGPYRTTPSRDNIPKDDAWNTKLVEETALLLVDVLQNLKKMGLLTVALLNTLPIRMDDFPEEGMFYPIVEAVRNALLDEELLPADDGTFVSARNTKLARGAELRKLLSSGQLQELFSSKEKVKWLSGEITQDRTPDFRSYLINELKVEEFTPDGFARKLTGAFLKNQSDEWTTEFYRFLNGQEALWKNRFCPLRDKPFIRLQNGTHVQPFNENNLPNAYLPLADGTEFPVVKPETTKDEKAQEFLKRLGLTKPDAVAEVIDRIIPKYTQDHPDISDNENMMDMKKILHAYSTDSREKKRSLAKSLRDTAFIRAENFVLQQIEYKKPRQLYFRNEQLIIYFDRNKDTWFVSSEYGAGFDNLFKDLKVDDVVRVKQKMPEYNRHIVITNYHSNHKRGLNGFDPGIEVDGLEFALTHLTIKKSEYIWNKIAILNSDCIRGKVETSSRESYQGSSEEKQVSEKFGRLLIDTPWLPDRQGIFHKPAELKLDELPESFDRNEQLANQLRMKKDVATKLAEEAGISTDDIDFIKQLKEDPEEYERVRTAVLARKEKPAFPTRISTNPDRRQERFAEQMNDAPEKKYEQRNRSVRTTANISDKETYLRNSYTNDDGQMFCQICKKEMPFRKRDGEYYFDAVEAFSKDLFPKEHEAQFLALCPLCTAMYKEFVKHDESAMESLKNDLLILEDAVVPLRLGELDTSIRFVATHFQDMKEIIKAYKIKV